MDYRHKPPLQRGQFCTPIGGQFWTPVDSRKRRPPAGTSNMPVSLPSASTIGADAEALQKRAPGDVLGQLLDRDPGLHAPDVRLAQHQLVEGDIARGAEDDLLNGGRHVGFSVTGGREPLSRPNLVTKPAQPSSLLEGRIPESRKSGSTDIRLCVSAATRQAESTIRLPPCVVGCGCGVGLESFGTGTPRSSPPPSTRRWRRARWRGCPRAAPRATNRYSRHGAPWA